MTTPFQAAADTLEFATKGWEGQFRVTTRLLGDTATAVEKQIDIDDRLARLIVTIEMMSASPPPATAGGTSTGWKPINWTATDFNATLTLPTPATDGYEIGTYSAAGGAPSWPSGATLPLFTKETMFPGKALQTILAVRTGFFAGSASSAPPGVKSLPINLEYKLEPLNPTDAGKHEVETDLYWFVASD